MMPIDLDTWDDGEEIYDAKRGHISHFATCPNADRHRHPRK
jgi:hypothetical protein